MKLRFIKRDGKMILQQHFTAEEFAAAGANFVHHHGWADVPVHEEPKYPTEEEIKNAAKHEDSDGYFGFIAGARWVITKMKGEK